MKKGKVAIKIIWTDGTKEVPGIGLVEDGKTYLVPKQIAKSLVAQGQAKFPKKQRGDKS